MVKNLKHQVMPGTQRKISTVIIGLMIVIGGFFYMYNRIYFSQGDTGDSRIVIIEKGDNALIVGEKLSSNGVISGKYYFLAYLWTTNKIHSMVAGTYEFPKGMQIPEATRVVTGGEVVSTRVKVTFPEGWTMKDYSQRLTANGFSGEDFLALAKKPSQALKDGHPFLQGLPVGASLEGYLFPDTYYFSKEASPDEIVKKMLDTFAIKADLAIKQDLAAQQKTLFEIVTMGSIIEGEVRNDVDRKIVAGLFWNRLENGMPLQSDATLEYALGTKKIQHSIAETKINSPYNSYQNRGLPPGPVSNPGLASILAALDPAKTDFVYFLSDPKTGLTAFAETFEEHIANKEKYGL